MNVTGRVLREDAIEQIEKIGQADIIVGVPSYQNAGTIGHVIETASAGLMRYFPNLRAVIVNSDGSPDTETRAAAASAPIDPSICRVVTEYQGLPGKGSAFHTIFRIADRLGAHTVIVLDSDLRSITPEWIKLLGEPIHKYSYGFVAPLYSRHKFDGTITNTIAYPLMCALYGRSIRQPIGGEFGLSGGLAKILSHQDIWQSDVARFGIDIWLTTTAVCEGFSVCQADMGVKLHDGKDPGADLGPMFKQVVGTIFELMRKYRVKWQFVDACRMAERVGKHSPGIPELVDVDYVRLFGRFKEVFGKYESFYPEIMGADSLPELKRLGVEMDSETLLVPDRFWARAVYDHAIAYGRADDSKRDDILGSLMALYLGRTVAFVRQAQDLSDLEVEEIILDGAEAFAAEKPYLVERWASKTGALTS